MGLATRRSLSWRASDEFSWLVFGGLPDLSVVRDLFARTHSRGQFIAFWLLALGRDLLRFLRCGKHYYCHPEAGASAGLRCHGDVLEREYNYYCLRIGLYLCNGRVRYYRMGETLRGSNQRVERTATSRLTEDAFGFMNTSGDSLSARLVA